jgi:hypothetical protein
MLLHRVQAYTRISGPTFTVWSSTTHSEATETIEASMVLGYCSHRPVMHEIVVLVEKISHVSCDVRRSPIEFVVQSTVRTS